MHLMYGFHSLISLAVIAGCKAAEHNQTFVFVSGWPQSGTSLVQQILTVAPAFATMVQKCVSLLGNKKCVNWNHEGQWLASAQNNINAKNAPGTFSLFKKAMQPGAMCPPTLETMREVQKSSQELHSFLMSQWSQFWDMSRPFLTEKSPQSMLKIPLLRLLFSGRGERLKFLIVVKHPATLNVALPKGMDWLTYSSSSSPSQTRVKIPNSPAQISANADYFIDFLSHRGVGSDSGDATRQSACSLGWVPAMEQLAVQLNASRAQSLADVRVLRYEHFQRPALVCRAIFDFLYSSSDPAGLEDAVARVCDVHFPSGQFAATSKTSPRKQGVRRVPPRRLTLEEEEDEEDEEEGGGRRRLRLHTPDESNNPYAQLTFRPDSIRRSVTDRLQDYFALYHHPAVTDAQRLKLNRLDRRLLRFGYSVGYTSPKAAKSGTILDEWDLIIRHAQKKREKNN